MIRLLISDHTALSDGEIETFLSELSEARRDRIVSANSANTRRERITASHLLESAIRADGYSGELAYHYDENGKPFFDHKGAPFFSISHSGRFVAVAICDQSVGIDIEDLSCHAKADFVGMAKRFFTPAEVGWIGDDRERFFRVWTYKEAYAKATGLSAAQHLGIWDFTECAQQIVLLEDLHISEPFVSYDVAAKMAYANTGGAILTVISL